MILQPTTPLSEYAGSISGGMLIPDNYGGENKSKVDAEQDIRTEKANSEMSNESPDQKLEKNQRQNSGLSDNSRTNKTASVTDSPLNQIVPLISSSPEIQKQSSGSVSPANRTAGSAGTAVSSVASNGGGTVDAAASSLQNKKISEADRAVNAHLSKEQDRLLAGSEVERLTRNTGMSGRATVSHRKKLAGHICNAKIDTHCLPQAACYGAAHDKFFCVFFCITNLSCQLFSLG